MTEIKTGVTLSLKDSFSQNMNKAAGAASGFAGKTLGAIEKVDKALSGTAAKLAAFGLSLSVGAAAKGIIEFDHKLTRIGLTFRATTEDILKLKQQIYDASLKYKINTDSITEAMDVLLTNTGDIIYATGNINNMTRAIQGLGMSGAEAADMLSQFNLFGYNSTETAKLLDDIAAMGDLGKATGNIFSTVGVKIMSSYGASVGKTTDDIKDLETTLLALMAGVGSADISATALEGIGADLSNADKQAKLLKQGINVINKETGKLRSYLEISKEIKAVTERKGNQFWLSEIFGETGLRGIRALMDYGDGFQKRVAELGDTTGTLQKKAATMAGTLQSNLQNLQTAFNRFADSNLSKLLSELTGLLNKLAEDPERIQKVFTGIAVGIGAIAAVKGIAGVSRLIGSITQLKSGKINITESLNMASAMPVYVTNWGGAGVPGIGSGGRSYQQTQLAKDPPLGNARTAGGNITAAQYGGAAAVAGIGAAFVKLPQMMNELEEIKQNEELTEKERGKAKGGAIGDATGSIVGAAAGTVAGGLLAAMATSAIAGTAIGTAVPGLGNIAGLIIGAGIGAAGYYLGGKLGRAGGEGIGGAMSANDGEGEQSSVYRGGSAKIAAMRRAGRYRMYADDLPPQITQTGNTIAPQKVELDGQAVMNVNVNLTGERPSASVAIQNNTTPFYFNTGSAVEARGVR